MDAKALVEKAEAAQREDRHLDAARLYLEAHQPYEAALAFQKGKALKECLDALLKVPRLAPGYRAACVHATRVAGILGEPLTRLQPLVAGFLETSPQNPAEATAMKELAETRAGSEAVNIYRRVLSAYPRDAEALEAIAELTKKADANLPFVANAAPAARPSAPKPSGKRFTDILVARGKLTAMRLQQVLTTQRELEGNDLLLGEALVADGTVSELDVVRAISEQTGIPFISGQRLLDTATAEALRLVPVDKAEKWKVCPIAMIDRHLWVAMRDPRDIRLTDQLRFVSNHPVNGVFATETALRKAIQKHYYGEKGDDVGQEDWRSWDQMPMVQVSRFSDRFTRTREHEFDTQEMIARTEAEGRAAKPPEPAPAPAPAPPLATPTGPSPRTSTTLETLRPLSIGATVASRYRLEAKLGEGGTATVFRAHDLELDEKVALKVFAPSARADSQVLRYKNELSLSRQLNHANLIRLFDLGAHDGWRYLSMELLEGVDLGTKLEQLKGPMPLVEGLIVLEQACAGLQFAHDAGVIHRDIKPGNLFITVKGVVKVMDFGIAKKDRGGQPITADGIVAGTPEYMSPEQISAFSSVTHLTDLYALGCTAFAMFSGAPPFTSDEVMAVLMQQVNNPPPSLRAKNGAVPLELDATVMRLLNKDPAKRFQSCDELKLVLERIRKSLAR